MRGPDVRKRNEKIILNLIHKTEGISQSEVAVRTGLKPPTVFRIFSELIERDLIQPLEDSAIAQQKDNEREEKKGRRPLLYQVVDNAYFAVGIDLTPKSISFVLIDFSGKILHKEVLEFNKQMHVDEIIDHIKNKIMLIMKGEALTHEKLLGVGIGIPGRVDLERGLSLNYPRIENFVNYPIKEKLEKEFDVPVFVHNNCSIIALSEYRYGCVRNMSPLLMILIRYGVGGGFIDQGNVLVSQGSSTLELGHISISMHGPRCTCGAHGCLETYLSEDAIIRDLRDHAKVDSFMSIDETTLENEAVREILKEKGKILAVGLRSLYQILFPKTLLIVTRSKIVSDFLTGCAKIELMKDMFYERQEITIHSSTYDPILYGRGASDLVWDHYLMPTEQ